jgi:hypothetical protein
LTIGGNFTELSVTCAFNPNVTGTVIFNDSSKTSTISIPSMTNFVNLTIQTANKQMKFDDTSRINVTGQFYVQGADCSNKVLLDSETDGDPWEIYVSGTHDVDYADVEDSTAVTTALTANSSTEPTPSGNTNWTVNIGSCGAVQPVIRGGTTIKGGVVIK